jgi:hypothetical protein
MAAEEKTKGSKCPPNAKVIKLLHARKSIFTETELENVRLKFLTKLLHHSIYAFGRSIIH